MRRATASLLARPLLAGIACAGAAACQTVPLQAETAREADLILTNARVYTVEPGQPWAEAVAVKDGRIEAVGSADTIARHRGEGTRVIDLKGRILMPSFGDAHVHPIFGGISHTRCPLHGGRSVEEYKQLIRRCVEESTSDVVYGVGWKDGLFPPDGIPKKEILDEISTDHALIFESTGGHSFWVNSKALAMAGITKDTPNPPNGVINRDPQTGEPNGGLQEAAMALAEKLVPPPTAAEVQNAIAYTAHHFNQLGITNWHDALIEVGPEGSVPAIEAYKAVKDRGELTAHVTMALKWKNDQPQGQIEDISRAMQRARELGFRADTVKLFIDGVIPQMTAAMIEPYAGTLHERGETQISPETLTAAVKALDARGMQVHFHAIGDRATRNALDAVEAARKADGMQDTRPMISHLNVVEPEDQVRFGQLGVTAVFQPLWACIEPYMLLTIEKVGPERAKHIYPANSILQSGGMLAYGSDWPVASANPFEGIEVALNRSDPYVADSKPLLPEQGVTLAQAIRAYTLNVSYANRNDEITGSIAPGKSADMIVLDRDLFVLPVRDISDTRVLVTLFGGREVFGSLDALGR